MGKSVVFDMGNVLIYFTPEHFIDREGITDEGDRELLMKSIYGAPEWPLMDSGDVREEELEEKVKKILPERLHAAAHRLIWEWEIPMEPVEGMAGFVKECKERGFGVYLLSNASFRQPEYWPQIPGSEYFDGTVISAYEHLVKPSPEIFRILLDRFHLNAADCYFIDDLPGNVAGAESVGMTGILFEGDVEKLRKIVLETK